MVFKRLDFLRRFLLCREIGFVRLFESILQERSCFSCNFRHVVKFSGELSFFLCLILLKNTLCKQINENYQRRICV